MTLIPFFIWFAYGLDQCSCWEPFSEKTLLIGFVILSFSVCGVFSSLPSPPFSRSLPLCPFSSSLLHPLLSFSPSNHFSLALHFLVVWGRILLCNLDWSWSVYTAQTGPKLSATLLSPPPGCWNHRCVQSHPGVSFLLNYYISALMHWHLSKQFYVGED